MDLVDDDGDEGGPDTSQYQSNALAVPYFPGGGFRKRMSDGERAHYTKAKKIGADDKLNILLSMMRKSQFDTFSIS